MYKGQRRGGTRKTLEYPNQISAHRIYYSSSAANFWRAGSNSTFQDAITSSYHFYSGYHSSCNRRNLYLRQISQKYWIEYLDVSPSDYGMIVRDIYNDLESLS